MSAHFDYRTTVLDQRRTPQGWGERQNKMNSRSRRWRAAVYMVGILSAWALSEEVPAPPDAEPAGLCAVSSGVRSLGRLIEIGGALGHSNVTNTIFERALREAARAIDPEAAVVRGSDREAFRSARAGHCWGLGFQTEVSNGQHVVVIVLTNGPVAGRLQVGDVLDRVADRFVTAVPVERWSAWIGEATGSVELVVMRPPLREPLRVVAEPAWVPPEVGEVEVLPRGIRLVRIAEMREGAAELVLKAWISATSARTAGVVLDLRRAGGFDLLEAARVAAAARPNRERLFEIEWLWSTGACVAIASPSSPLSNAVPLVLLIGPETRDAAEALAAAMVGGGAPTIRIGRATSGSLCRYEFVHLDGEFFAWMPVRRLRMEGTVLEGPVQPELGPGVRVAGTREQTEMNMDSLNPRRRPSPEEEEDRQLWKRIAGDGDLEQAVELLLGLRALGVSDVKAR